MPSFLNREERYILTTSLKVMYSTLTRQRVLTKLSPRSPWPLRLLVDRRLRHFMLTRHPYTRLVSFYSDKIAGVNMSLVAQYGWQRCQRIFFPYVSVTGDEDAAIIRDRLCGLSFDRFVQLLDEVVALDEHLVPQVESRYRRLRHTPFGVRLRVDRMIPMETDLEFLTAELRLDLAIRENRSCGVDHRDLFTPALYAIVNRIYARDFAELGYSPS